MCQFGGASWLRCCSFEDDGYCLLHPQRGGAGTGRNGGDATPDWLLAMQERSRLDRRLLEIVAEM
jgi:hypothetical protein